VIAHAARHVRVTSGPYAAQYDTVLPVIGRIGVYLVLHDDGTGERLYVREDECEDVVA